MGFTKLEKSVLNVSALPDKVENQARQLKATFDQAGADIKEAHNQLIDELDANTAAGNIGAVSAKTGAKTTVQAELDKLNDRIKVDFTELEIDIDDELDTESENAVKNKVIAKEVNTVKGDLYAADRYNKPVVTAEERMVSEVSNTNIFTPNGWTLVTAYTEYERNGYELKASSISDSEHIPTNAFSTSHWLAYSPSKDSYIQIKLDKVKKITKMKACITTTKNNSDFGGSFNGAKIQGSFTGDEWVDLYEISEAPKTKTPVEMALNNADYYLYYRIYFNAIPDSMYNAVVSGWETTEWEEEVTLYSYTNNLSLPLKSYEVGKIVNIEGSSYEEVTSFENPYININNLGAKQINGTIKTGEKYNLIYNGESFDITSETDVVTGIYTGGGGYVDIVLGFKPRAVFVYPAGSVNTNYIYRYQAVASEQGNSPNIRINDDGFRASYSGDWSIVVSSYVFQYIAFK